MGFESTSSAASNRAPVPSHSQAAKLEKVPVSLPEYSKDTKSKTALTAQAALAQEAARMAIGRHAVVSKSHQKSSQKATSQHIERQPLFKPPVQAPIKYPAPPPLFILVKIQDPTQDFWPLLFGDNNFKRFADDVLADKSLSNDKKATQIVNKYATIVKENGLSITYEERNGLFKQLMQELESQKSTISQGPREHKIRLNRKDTLTAYATKADGSCGFHAVLGDQVVKGVYVCSNVQAARTHFCEWLQIKHAEGQLPKSIERVLTDYFYNTDNDETPKQFTEAVATELEHYKAGYDDLTKAEKDKRLAEFLDDPAVFNAYINHLNNPKVWLLQDELEAVAECFNKKVVLYQTLHFKKEETGSTVFNPGGSETVHVWYRGQSHYEKAKLN